MRAVLFVVCMGALLGAFVLAWNSGMSWSDISLPRQIASDNALPDTFDQNVVLLAQNSIQSALKGNAQLKDLIDIQQKQFKSKLMRLGEEVEKQMQQVTMAIQFPYNRINNPNSPHHLTVILPYRNRETNLMTIGTSLPIHSTQCIFALFSHLLCFFFVLCGVTWCCGQCHTCISIWQHRTSTIALLSLTTATMASSLTRELQSMLHLTCSRVKAQSFVNTSITSISHTPWVPIPFQKGSLIIFLWLTWTHCQL